MPKEKESKKNVKGNDSTEVYVLFWWLVWLEYGMCGKEARGGRNIPRNIFIVSWTCNF